MSAPHSPRVRQSIAPSAVSAELSARLLDPDDWREVLAAFASASRLGIALLDSNGVQVGPCHNPRPVWELARKAQPQWGERYSFCLMPASPCNAAEEALRSDRMIVTGDRAGMAHVAVPLHLGRQAVGAIIAGQVFDHFPDAARLRWVARDLGIPAQELWDLAIQQTPMSQATLKLEGELLRVLGNAFLRKIYGALVERKLMETDTRFRLLMENVKEYAIYTEDSSRRVTSWNSGAEKMFGYTETEILGRESPRMFTPQELEDGVPAKEQQAAQSDGQSQVEHWQIRKDGSTFLASSTLARISFENQVEFGRITHDITDQRKQEAAMLQKQKMESVGILAGGVAHDFNNMLSVVMLNASNMLDELSPADPKRRPLDDIIAAGQTAAGLTRQLMAYSGKPRPSTAPVDLSKLVQDMLRLMDALIPERVTLEQSLAPGLALVEADTTLLEQIIMNLVVNAVEAIGPREGYIRVSTRPAEDGIFFEVKDSGCGMDEATLARAFDPFFTTKRLGRGLGLAAVFGIVRAHHGRTEIESSVGEGTTFRIFLPNPEPA